MKVIRHSEQKVVPFARPMFFGVIADVASYEKFLPWCTSSRVLARFGRNKFDAELAVGFNLWSEKYISRVVLEPDSHIRVAMHSSPILKSLSNDWKLEDHNDGTLVTFDVAFEFKNAMHSAAAKLFFQEVHSRLLNAFLKRAEQLERQGKT